MATKRPAIRVQQPMVIDTELQPLNESLYIEASASTEQWYSDNTSTDRASRWSPDRTTTPLQLTPKLSVLDIETNLSYTPSFTAKWYVQQYNATSNKWEETEVTTTDTTADFYKASDNKSLMVRKNVSYDRGITCRCVVTYTDPRDSGSTYKVQASQLLSSNRDAKAVYPLLDIDVPNTQSFNPLTDCTYDSDGTPHGYYEFTLKALLNNSDIVSSLYVVWYAVDTSNNTETLVEKMPWYVSGQNTTTLKIDAMYSEYIRILARVKASSTATDLYPSRCYRTVGWRIPTPQINTVSHNGAAFRSSFKEMDFFTMANLKGKLLDDTIKARHIYFEWKTRKSNGTTETSRGWGQEITLSKDILGNVRANGVLPSTLVIPYGYILGPYEPVTDASGNVVTDDSGNTVYDRAVDA